MTSEKIIIRLTELFATCQVQEIGASVDTLIKSVIFQEFPLDVKPEEDLEVLRSPLMTVDGKNRINAICIDERTLEIAPLIQSRTDDDTSHFSFFSNTTDYETYTFRIWIWLNFGIKSSILARRYRDSLKNKIKTTPKLGFTGDDADKIQSVSRLRTDFTDLFYSKSGAVHIIANELSVKIID